MRYLLDTCTLLWAISDSKELPKEIKALINNPNNMVIVSGTSILEIEIKHQKNPELMPYSGVKIYNIILRSGFTFIDIRVEQVFKLEEIVKQNIHKDPFDHLLLATAIEEKATLISHDELIARYQGVNVLHY